MDFGVGYFPTHDAMGPGPVARLVEEHGVAETRPERTERQRGLAIQFLARSVHFTEGSCSFMASAFHPITEQSRSSPSVLIRSR